MSTVSGAPPTALERLRSNMRENQMQSRRQNAEFEASRTNFRQSMRVILDEEQITKLPMTGKDLQEFTNIQFYASFSFVNFASFCCVLSVTFCLGWMGWGRDIKDDYKSIHDEYQSLLTNVFWSNAGWLLIFTCEAIFVAFQLLSVYENLPIIEESIMYWFFAVNCCQLGWIISYCFDIIWLATLFMAGVIGFLAMLNISLYQREYVNGPLKEGSPQDRNVPEVLKELNIVLEYVVFRMPFQLHLGWASFVFFVNVNEIWAKLGLSAPGIIAIISIVALWIFGLCILFIPRYPLFILPVMIAWGAVGTWVEISNPRFGILTNYEEIEIGRMKGAAIATTIEHVLLPIIRFAIHFASTYNLLEKEEPAENLPGF